MTPSPRVRLPTAIYAQPVVNRQQDLPSSQKYQHVWLLRIAVLIFQALIRSFPRPNIRFRQGHSPHL